MGDKGISPILHFTSLVLQENHTVIISLTDKDLEDTILTMYANNNFKNKTKCRIGFFIDALDIHFQNQVMEGVREACERMNVDLLVYAGAILYEQDDSQNLYTLVKRYIHKEEIDGLLVLTGAISSHYRPDKIEAILHSITDIPIVSIASLIQGCGNVLIDNTMGIRELFYHLYEVHGSRRIAYLMGPEGHYEAEERLESYRECLKERGLTYDESIVIKNGEFNRESGYAAAKKLDQQGLAEIDAIMATDDCSAVGVLQYLKEAGYAVPGDILVTGFDNIDSSKYESPSISTVVQPFKQQGESAVELLIEQIKNPRQKKDKTLPIELCIRESCGCEATISSTLEDRDSPMLPHAVLQEWEGLIQSDSPDWILHKLKEVLQRDYKKRIPLAPWLELLKEIPRLNSTSNLLPQAIDQLPDLYSLYFDFLQLETKREHMKNDISRYDLYFLSHQILSTFNQDDLFQILKQRLPELQIKSFFLCLYNELYSYEELKSLDQLPRTELSLCYSEKQDLLDIGNRRILENQLLPAGIMESERDLIFLPLSFKGIHFGYIVFDFNTEVITKLYEILRISIGSALHSCNLMKRLEDSVSHKTNFLVNLTHEMKTPLTLIASYLEKYLGNPTDIKDIQIAQSNVNKMKRDMENILDFEKLQRGKAFYSNPQVIELSQWIKDKLLSFQEIASNSGISLTWEMQNNLYITIDPAALDRVLNNLLENAIRYNKTGGVVSIGAQVQDDNILFEVSNSGQMIPEDLKSRIFDPYYQLQQEKQNDQGIGIGLSIVNSVMNEIGGSISLDTKSINTKFNLTFPRADAPQNYPYGLPLADSKPQAFLTNLSIEEIPYNPIQSNILIVEDNPQMLAFLKNQLNPFYNVYYALNPMEALALFERIPLPDLIISDVMMDEMDGFQFLEALKKRERFKYIPLLFLSAKNDEESKILALEKGAIDYVSKPFSLQLLLIKIENLILTNNNQRLHARENLKKDLCHFLEEQQRLQKETNHQNPFLNNRVMNQVFTKREQEAISLLEKGHQYKEIASEMGISLNTLKTYIKRMYSKLEVNNRVELLRKIRWNNQP